MKNKITYILIMLGIFTARIASAQYSLSLNLVTPAPTYFSDWGRSNAGNVNVQVTTDKIPSSLIKFRVQLMNENGSQIADNNPVTSPVYTVKYGINVFTLDKVLQPESLRFTDGAVIRSIRTNGRLPAGIYQICVQLLNGTSNLELLRAPVCRTFIQVNYQLPYLLSPSDKTWLDANIAQSVITFRWSSIVPQPKEPVIYRIQVFEVKDNQQPMQALRSNQPILETELRNTTQYFWRPLLNLKDSTGHIFIWTVQTLDSKGYPIPTVDDNTQGRSEPMTFGVCNKLGKGGEGPAEECTGGRKL